MDRFQKNEKYKDLMKKLSKSLENEFYYEAIFIEFAIMEDRTSSLLKHAHLSVVDSEGKDLSLSRKLNQIKKNKIFHQEYIQKHIPKELIDEIYDWKKIRNKLIHALVNTQYSNENIKRIALDGCDIVKKLNTKSTLVTRYLDRQ